jgi:hypothetical protein
MHKGLARMLIEEEWEHSSQQLILSAEWSPDAKPMDYKALTLKGNYQQILITDCVVLSVLGRHILQIPYSSLSLRVYNSVPLHLGLLWLPVVHQLLF